MKNLILDDVDKEQIYNVIMKIEIKTKKQKDRFIRFYGLKPTEFKRETLKTIAKSYKCTPEAVKISIMSLKIYLHRISEDDFEILETIYQKYKK